MIIEARPGGAVHCVAVRSNAKRGLALQGKVARSFMSGPFSFLAAIIFNKPAAPVYGLHCKSITQLSTLRK